MQKPDYILVDGSSYLYRAYHALPELTTSSGQATGAIKGVVSMLKVLQRDYPLSNIIVVFDARGKSFRSQLYPEYKANRPSMPNDLASQTKLLHEVILAMGLPLLSITGVEADDVIASLAKAIQQAQQKLLIASSDKDLMQLVGDTLHILSASNNEILDAQKVTAKFGVAPEQIRGFLALLGDASDNIPGVPKVGNKTAAKLINEYGSLEQIIANAQQIKGKVGENIRDNLEQLHLSYELIKLKDDVELQSIDSYTAQTADIDKLTALFSQLEFKGWLQELTKSSEQQSTQSTFAYQLITNDGQLKEICAQIKQDGICSLDIVTSSDNYMQAKLTNLAISTKSGQAAYLNIHNTNPGFNPIGQLTDLLNNTEVTVVGYDIKHLLHLLHNHHIAIKAQLFDVMLASYSFNISATNHQLPQLSSFYLNKELVLNESDPEAIASYSCQKAAAILELHTYFQEHLSKQPALLYAFNELEMPSMYVLAAMEQYGTLVDKQKLVEHDAELAGKLIMLEQGAHALVGRSFNLASTKQLQTILYEELQMPVTHKTPKGQPSTAEAVLVELANDYELPQVVLQHRSLSKLKSSYTSSLPQQINPETGRIHPSYHQGLTVTGRLSCSNPNLQNIPIRNSEGRKIRQAFIAKNNYKIVSADYSQIELRIMAHLSAEPNLLDAFANNLDVHQATAAEVLGIPITEVTSEQRRHAKAVNFGLIYGMSAFGLAKQLKISRQEAQNYIDTYFARYPRVLDYMNLTRETASEHGYVETILKRRLYIPNINAKNMRMRQGAQRAAINGPMQGSAADIIKIAMIDTHAWLTENKIDAHIIMQVHDELVLEVEQSSVKKVITYLPHIMSAVTKLNVPLDVSIGVGDNWDTAH